MNIKDNVSKNYNLIEVSHGIREVQIAYINGKTGETLTPFCRCKDYFNDLFYSNKTNKAVKIFGFHWKPNQDLGELSRNTLVLAIRLRDRNDTSRFYEFTEEERQGIFYLLSQFTKINDLGRIIVRFSEDKKNLIIYFNKKWTDIPYLNSAFYFLIRMGITYKKDEDIFTWYSNSGKFISPNDQMYFKNSQQRIIDLLSGKIDDRQKYEDYDSGSIHGNSGLVNYRGYRVDYLNAK